MRLHCGWILLKFFGVCMIECNRIQLRNCTHFGHPSDEHSDIFIRDNQLSSVLTEKCIWTSLFWYVWCSRDHRKEMSTSYVVMKEAWKKFTLERDLDPWPVPLRSIWPSPRWLGSSDGRAQPRSQGLSLSLSLSFEGREKLERSWIVQCTAQPHL